MKEKLILSNRLSFYLAGSFTEKEKIRGLMDQVEGLGGTITSDWTTHPSIYPYIDNQQTASEFAVEDLEGAKNCRFFVVFPEEEGGSTQFAELGAAIISDKVERIFVVGENNHRSLSFFHPRVERVENFDQVLEAAGLKK
jgi:hypothetical protein